MLITEIDLRSDVQRQVVASAGLANSAFRHNYEGHFKSEILCACIAEMFGGKSDQGQPCEKGD